MRVKTLGFTLLEILIVLVILGVVSSFAALSVGDFGGTQRATAAAEEFSAYIKLLQSKAIFGTSTLGVQVTPKGYQTFFTNNNKTWQVASESIFRARYFPESIIVSCNRKVHFNVPNILINNTGDMTSFKITFGTLKNPGIVSLIGEHNGNLKLIKNS